MCCHANAFAGSRRASSTNFAGISGCRHENGRPIASSRGEISRRRAGLPAWQGGFIVLQPSCDRARLALAPLRLGAIHAIAAILQNIAGLALQHVADLFEGLEAYAPDFAGFQE
jgi:hypothetical protein